MPEAATARFEATADGLRGELKQLPSVWLYDERGSYLYEQVTQLPSYYLPRREREILRAAAPVVAERTGARTLVELGAGAAKNTRILLDALAISGTLQRFVPIDVSEEALHASARAIAASYPGVRVDPVAGDFDGELDALDGDVPRVIAFLGSTIGNLSPEQRERFLAHVASVLGADDAFLVGVDLVKDVARLQAAYADPGGVTEAFIRNALTAVNTELGATFDQGKFSYAAAWEPRHEWMDIGVRARERHTVSIPMLELEVPFDEGEHLRVEISTKFRRARFDDDAAAAGLKTEFWWTDDAGDFAVALLRRTPD
jgi:L-histidine N-alpha-methyltransferase